MRTLTRLPGPMLLVMEKRLLGANEKENTYENLQSGCAIKTALSS